MNLMSMRAARHGGAVCRSAHHAQAHDRSERRRRPPRRRTHSRVDPRTGTTVLPLASNSRMVAGMRGRAIEAPGEPGIISAEEDVLDINYEHSGP